MKATKTIIIGSGVAAVAVARRILSKNNSAEIKIIEAGDDLPIGRNQAAKVPRKWLDFVMTKIPPTREFEDRKQDADIIGDSGFGLVGGRLLVRGGSTNHWGGWCPRMKEEDFRLGDVRSNSINWPITYKDIANYYTQAEAFLHVSGDSSTTSVPRYNEKYPYDAVPFTALDQLLIPTLNDLKFGYEALPIARNAKRCRTTGTCRYCPMDARYAAGSDLSALVAEFPGRIQIQLNAPVVSIKMRDKKTAEGINYIDNKSQNFLYEAADQIIVAAGTIESPKILLASKHKNWPAGLGNVTGHVGRHLITHPLIRAVATLPSNPQHLEQEIDFPTMACRHFDTKDYQRTGKMFFVRDGKYIVIPLAERLIAGKKPEDIAQEIENNTRIELRALIEAFPDENNKVDIASGSDKTRVGLPRSKIIYNESSETKAARIEHLNNLQKILYKANLKPATPLDSSGARCDHATGTCRMSANPQDGVVDSNLRIHDTDNIFICSNAIFPNSGAVNPTLTLVALSLRLGDFLTQE